MQQNTQNQPKFYVGQKVISIHDHHVMDDKLQCVVTDVTESTVSVSYRGSALHLFGPYKLDGSDGVTFIPDPRVKQEPPKEDKEEPQMFYPEPGDTIVCRNGEEYTCVAKEDFDFGKASGYEDWAIFTDNSGEQGFMTWKDHTGKIDGNSYGYEIAKIIPKVKPVQQDPVQTEEPAVYSVRQVVDAVAELNPYLVKRDDYEQQIKALETYLAKINDPDWKTYQELKQKFKE